MKKITKILTAACLSAALLSSLALAAVDTPEEPVTAVPISAPVDDESDFLLETRDAASLRVWGELRKLDENRVQLTNSNEEDPYRDIILNISDSTLILDAVTGEPVKLEDVKEGEVVYADVSRMMTMSLPPISNALVILVNVPQDYAVPTFAEVQSVRYDAEKGTLWLSTDQHVNYTITAECELSAYLSDDEIDMQNIRPGMRVLAWYEVVALSYPAQAGPTKMILFPSNYSGSLELTLEGELYVNDKQVELDEITAVRKADNGALMFPLRKTCEALGLIVSWEQESLSALVSDQEGKMLVKVAIGSDIATLPEDGEWLLDSETQLIDSTTFVSAIQLSHILNTILVNRF